MRRSHLQTIRQRAFAAFLVATLPTPALVHAQVSDTQVANKQVADNRALGTPHSVSMPRGPSNQPIWRPVSQTERDNQAIRLTGPFRSTRQTTNEQSTTSGLPASPWANPNLTTQPIAGVNGQAAAMPRPSGNLIQQPRTQAVPDPSADPPLSDASQRENRRSDNRQPDGRQPFRLGGPVTSNSPEQTDEQQPIRSTLAWGTRLTGDRSGQTQDTAGTQTQTRPQGSNDGWPYQRSQTQRTSLVSQPLTQPDNAISPTQSISFRSEPVRQPIRTLRSGESIQPATDSWERLPTSGIELSPDQASFHTDDTRYRPNSGVQTVHALPAIGPRPLQSISAIPAAVDTSRNEPQPVGLFDYAVKRLPQVADQPLPSAENRPAFPATATPAKSRFRSEDQALNSTHSSSPGSNSLGSSSAAQPKYATSPEITEASVGLATSLADVYRVPKKLAPLPSQTIHSIESPIGWTAVEGELRQRLQRCDNLLRRKACLSAREEGVQGLRSLARALDVRQGGFECEPALDQAIVALDEALDFTNSAEHNGSLGSTSEIVATHQTDVLRSYDLTNVSPDIAAQHYRAFARDRLIMTTQDHPWGADVLYAIGKSYEFESETDNAAKRASYENAVVFYHAALRINPSQTDAANQLGYMLLHLDRTEEAEQALVHAYQTKPSVTIAQNLMELYRRQGNQSAMSWSANQIASFQTPESNAVPQVQSLSPREFMQISPQIAAGQPAAQSSVQVASTNRTSEPKASFGTSAATTSLAPAPKKPNFATGFFNKMFRK